VGGIAVIVALVPVASHLSPVALSAAATIVLVAVAIVETRAKSRIPLAVAVE